MTEQRKTSAAGIALIKRYEGLSLKPYLCPAGKWTIGYGCTGESVKPDSIALKDETEADALLQSYLARFEKAVSRNVRTHLTQWQFDALVSFVFNLGEGALQRSTLLKYLNEGRYKQAADEFLKWNKAEDRTGKKVTMPGLVARRQAERQVFLGNNLNKTISEMR